jgi:hypothetical protein
MIGFMRRRRRSRVVQRSKGSKGRSGPILKMEI